MNAINWFEVPTTDLDRATKFYETILGTEMIKVEMGGFPMHMFPADMETGVGGHLASPGDGAPGENGSLIYLNCNGKIDDVLGRVEAAGGAVMLPKTHIGDPGYIAFIRDSEGNKIGLHSSA